MGIDCVPHRLTGLVVLRQEVPVVTNPFMGTDSRVVQQYVVFTAATVPPQNRSLTPVMQVRPQGLLVLSRPPVIR